MYKYRLLLFSLSLSFLSHTASFSEQWKMMQQEYQALSESFNNQNINTFMHPYWQNQKQNMANLIRGNADQHFLLKGPISGPMVRSEWCKTQDYEVVHLQNCIKNSTRQLIQLFKDTEFGGLPFKCKEFNCSINALGQLFFFTKILERNDFNNPKTIVEIGGGYGCLARVTKMIKPNTTYIILDLPEYIAIQSLYLRSTLIDNTVNVHKKTPNYFKPGQIHLVPVFLINDININADIFISTAALSETPEAVQKIVVDKKFFNADSAYLTGQLNKWGTQYDFEHHKVIFDGIDSCYKLSFAQPLHHFGGSLNSYEIYGMNSIQK